MNGTSPETSAPRVISLRLITECSEEQQMRVRELRNDESVRASMYTDHEISLSEHRDWIERLRSDRSSIVFVVLRDDERPIGVVSVTRIDPVHLKADWAFYLDAYERGGLGATLEFNVIEFVFGELGLEKLNCEVIETNDAVIRMHKKFGFEQEGLRRSNIVKHGRRIGVCFLGLTRSDWEIKRAAIIAKYEAVFSKFQVTSHRARQPVTAIG